METEDQQVARFIGGLRVAIQDKVFMHPVFTLNEAVSFATRAEKQLERSRAPIWDRNLSDSTRPKQGRGKQPLVPMVTPSQPVTSMGKGAAAIQKYRDNQPTIRMHSPVQKSVSNSTNQDIGHINVLGGKW
jgi:hypothetical protein